MKTPVNPPAGMRQLVNRVMAEAKWLPEPLVKQMLLTVGDYKTGGHPDQYTVHAVTALIDEVRKFARDHQCREWDANDGWKCLVCGRPEGTR